MAKIISISLSEEDKKLLDVMQLSPSGLMKQKLFEVRENASNYQKLISEKDQAIERLLKLNRKLLEFVESKNLSDEFIQMEK